MSIKHYWLNKEQRAEQAKTHVSKMNQQFSKNIDHSVLYTKLYNDFMSETPHNYKQMKISVQDLDSVSAGMKYSVGGEKVAILNFASYKNPGGRFLDGSCAQEECLCHASTLYNVLCRFTIEFYDWNNRNKNRALYHNRALYTPEIYFYKDNHIFVCDVITCAAPNKFAAQKYANVSDTENSTALQERIKFILDVAVDNSVETLILGAYGCGVFGQDPEEVATIFKTYLETDYKNSFREVVFAIPDDKNGNLKAFRKLF